MVASSTVKDVPLPAGLTSDEARRRIEASGPNAVPDTAMRPLRRALTKFWAPVPWMLEAANRAGLLRGFVDARKKKGSAFLQTSERRSIRMKHQPDSHFLQIPGPTSVPDDVLGAVDNPTIDRGGRGPEVPKRATNCSFGSTGTKCATKRRPARSGDFRKRGATTHVGS